MTTYYSPTGAPVADTRGSSTSIRNEFQAIAAGFTSASSDIAARGLVAGQTWTGTHDYSGAVLKAATASPGSTGNAVATIDYVNAAPFGPAGINAAMITSALGYTPYNAANPASYISVVSSAMVNAALGYTPYNGAMNLNGYLSTITAGAITAALGFAPYNSANPGGYITAAALSPYLTSATAGTTYLPLAGGTLTGPAIMGNAVAIRMKNSAGTAKDFAYVSSTNYTELINAGGNGFRFWNQAVTTNIASLSDTGTFSAVVVTQTSDERKKSHWRRAPLDLIDRLAALRKAGLFRWKKSGIASLGVGAQSLEEFLPEAVHTDDSGNKTVNYGGAAMVGVVELCRRVVELEARLSKLERK